MFALAATILFPSALPATAQNRLAFDPEEVVGCYRMTDNLPWRYSVDFCLTLNQGGHFSIEGPGVRCDQDVSWTAMSRGVTPLELPEAFIHVNVKWLGMQCGPAAEVLTDDLYCALIASGPNRGDLDCIFDEERHLPARRLTANRVL